MALQRYRRVLQDHISRNDSKWSYILPDLPNATNSNAASYVKSCSVVSNSEHQNITLSFNRVQINRAISERPLDSFCHVTFGDFRLQTEDGAPAPFKESAEYVAKFLKAGVNINGIQYHFYGHSQSQLKSKACFLMAGTKDAVNRAVDALGDFSKMKTVAKKVKRIGLLFSTAQIVMDVEEIRCRDIADIENEDYIFTDGCGLISNNLAKMLSSKRPINFRNKRYHPSVFQIRYRGYKGVVTLEPKMDPGIWLELRKSMKKFSGGSHLGFAVVEYSKPYMYGYLNDEVVLLLHSLGITVEVLQRKQQEHLDILNKATQDPRAAFWLLNSLGHHETSERLLLEGREKVERSVSKIVAEEYAKMLNKRGEQKCRILVPKSRLLFGVCDPRDCLQPGECFVKVTHDDGIPRAITGAWVLVARNPCLHPGDLQKFWAVAHPELEHLVDCITFSTRGERPAADLMSGGDLDGDTFFVCWDQELIPSTVSEPAEYPAGKEQLQFKPITHDDRIDYFASSSSMQLGRIKKVYLQWARLKGPLSSQCQELNRLFSMCVDANRVKIPDRLLEFPDASPLPFILDMLHDTATNFIKKTKPKIDFSQLSKAELLEEVLCEENSMSQFELAQLTVSWCQTNKASFQDFWLFIDPRKLSTEERYWLLAQLPSSPQTPTLVMNDLLHSEILAPAELHEFGLHHPRVRWRLIFSSRSGRLGNLLNMIDRAFPTFHRKLLVFNVNDRLSVAIYIPTRIERADECVVDGRVRLFSFPHTQKSDQTHRSVVPSKVSSIMYYDQSTLQLYEGKRANTFVFLTRSANDDSLYRAAKGRGEKLRLRQSTIEEGVNHEWRTSIALGKFSQGLATHIGRLNREGISSAELYVISNDDMRSFQHLDLWLEQVDTDKIVRNFEAPEEDFEVPHAGNVDWNAFAPSIVAMARDKRFDSSNLPQELEQVKELLDLAWQISAFDVASAFYQRFLGSLGVETEARPKLSVLYYMLEFLGYMPKLVLHFVKLRPWGNLALCVQDVLRGSVHLLQRALILSSSTMNQLAVDYVRQILQETHSLAVDKLADLAELVALTTSSAEVAMSILLEGFEPCSTRVLLETPQKTEYLMRSITGIVLDHIEEAADQIKAGSKDSDYAWKFERNLEENEKGLMLRAALRIDAPTKMRLAKGDHVRFTSAGEPSNMAVTKPWAFEAVVETSQAGEVSFRCVRRPPDFYQKGWWKMQSCGSFVTSKTMLDAVADLMIRKTDCCRVFENLFPSQVRGNNSVPVVASESVFKKRSDLNSSQNNAIGTALLAPFTLIWGPPGTGKTHTIVALCQELLKRPETGRLLVTAPTHNAVDNVMRKFVERRPQDKVPPLRVSTDVHKVSKDLQHLTCDAMLGKDIHSNHAARRKAQKQISASRLIFTTCVGAGLGLLRTESFDTVIIDEASQQTEPASLIPLVKGCAKAILVGDHVQLRATVRPNAATQGYDVSLFERLWTESSGKHAHYVQKIMLDTQYRMHPTLCAFPSAEFYDSKLLTAPACAEIPLHAANSHLDWPSDGKRAAFIQCNAPEDLGMRSKSNDGQAKLCQDIIKRLKTPKESTPPQPTAPPTHPTLQPSIAILTPYTRQLTLLRKLIADAEIKISTIDGFQGQEADIIVYVSVRCNVYGEIGFLKDLRRLNVAITRPRAGLIIIGDKATLIANKTEEGEAGDAARTWERLIQGCG